ncbi:MAG: Hsp20/alpha crystallin family protein [Bacilli bacterium]|nr:Hsp20/alpha crystallin family protein [Bacilli bacterium]
MFPSRLFDEVFNEKNKMNCDVYEKENKIFVEVDMPGFTKEDIKLEVNKGYLTITAEKNQEENDKQYICRERTFYGKYQRSFYLGDIEEENIEAKFNNGILTIEIPKRNEQDNKKYIEIK